MDKINANEVTKLQDHLALLRSEYGNLQIKYSELEKKYLATSLISKDSGENTFVANILRAISELFGQNKYSDLSIRLQSDIIIPAHKFVLLARSQFWGILDLNEVDELDWTHFSKDVGISLGKWIYTSQLDSSNVECVLCLMKVANMYSLAELVITCENSLISAVDRSNCIKFYMTAVEISACKLKEHCSGLISTHWCEFTKEDFNPMPADMLHRMLLSKSRFPLHDAIRVEREDVVFLNLGVSELNEADDKDQLPLDVALETKQQCIAKSLVDNGANINATDKDGRSLLHKAILRCDQDGLKFLLDNGANPSQVWPATGETPMHLVCQSRNNLSCVVNLLQAGPDINSQRLDGKSPLHVCVETKNLEVMQLILDSKLVDIESTTTEGECSLWLALKRFDSDQEMNKVAQILINAGASPNAICKRNQNSLLQCCAEEKNEGAGAFLCHVGANVNHINLNGETPFHLACRFGLSLLVSELLKHKADPTLIIHTSGDSGIHIAIKQGHTSCVLKILEEVQAANDYTLGTILNLRDLDGLTPLGVSLSAKNFELSKHLVENGSDVNVMDLGGQTLLDRFIRLKNTEAATFLLNQNAFSSVSQMSSLLLAVEHDLPIVVETLCKKGSDMSVVNADGDCLLWLAMQKPSKELASILVRFGIDTDYWSEGIDGQYQTLLHRSIIEKREDIACFLIQAGCDTNSPRGFQKNAADLPSPLYLCADNNCSTTVACLLNHGAQVNMKGPEGKTALHVAIQRKHQEIVKLLIDHSTIDLSIRDKFGHAAFAVAMQHKENVAAQMILKKFPAAAEQYNSRGKNYLHESISDVNVENVMFLLSINIDVNSRTKDAKMLSSLHLAVEARSELLVRNLLLAGANIHDRTPQKWTGLHIAAKIGDANIMSILLDNGADVAAVDSEHNNALNISVKNAQYDCCKLLLHETQINAETGNIKGQNPLHLLARYGKENAVDILNLFLECMPNYPVNKPDVDGSSALLLAYINGHGDLCRALVKNHASLGNMNKDGITIFNYQVPTRQLLYRLLDYLTEEPPWVEGEVCLECGLKFSITVRKHHCRHCGRILCNSCSGKDIPIVKFNINKPVRVCGPCFHVLALGGAMA